MKLGVKVADGRTSEVFRLGESDVVKLLKPNVPSEWASFEAAMIDAVRLLGVPAPEVRGVFELDGRSGLVIERVDGPTMWQRLLDHPNDAATMGRQLFDAQLVVHNAGVPDDLPGLVDRMGLKLGEAESLTPFDRSSAQELLSSMPAGAALLHGDLHPGNVMLGSKGLQIIDWFDAAVGHPVADIARTILLVRESGATDLRHLPGGPADLIADVSRSYLECVKGVGVAPLVLADWKRLVAASRLAEGTDSAIDSLLSAWRLGADELSVARQK